MEDMHRLSDIEPFTAYVVTEIGGNNVIRRRLRAFGVMEGTHICCIGCSFDGTLCTYSVRGAIVALRRTDAERILVKREDDYQTL